MLGVQMDSGGGSRGGEATATAQAQDNNKGKAKQQMVVNYTVPAGSKGEGSAGGSGGGVTVSDCELERLEYSGGAVVGWAAVVIIVAAVAAWATFVTAYGAQAMERERGCHTGLILALSEVARCREGMLTTDNNYTRAAEASPSPQTTASQSLSPLPPPADTTQHQKAAPSLPAFFVSDDRTDQDFRPRWTGALGTYT
jgi:hypothetical protein